MAKTHIFRYFSIICIIIFSFSTFGQAIVEGDFRKKWFTEAIRYNGILEKGYNRHDTIQKINKWVKSPPFAPYCAAGLAYTAHNVGLNFSVPYPAAVKNWFLEKDKVIYTRGHEYRGNASQMDVVWVFTSHLEAIAQIRIRRDITDDEKFMTVGFNTTGNTNSEGIHYPIWRRWRDVRKIANHITPYTTNLKNEKRLNTH